MLVLTRGVDEDICIGSGVRVRVVAIHGNQVRLGIDAPVDVPVYRGELLEAIRRQNRAASSQTPEAVSTLRQMARAARGEE